MQGRITVTQAGSLKIHTFTAPEKGWQVNSHIIDLPSQLLVIDAQYLLPYAREVVSYALQLQKPITRLYVSHYHPDHLLGAVAFSAPIAAMLRNRCCGALKYAACSCTDLACSSPAAAWSISALIKSTCLIAVAKAAVSRKVLALAAWMREVAFCAFCTLP